VSQQDPHTEARTASRTDGRTASRTDGRTASRAEPAAGARGRIALVTGGNRGLGRSSVLRLAADGVDPILTYRSHADEARDVVAEVAALGRTARALRLDTGRIEEFPGFADELAGRNGSTGPGAAGLRPARARPGSDVTSTSAAAVRVGQPEPHTDGSQVLPVGPLGCCRIFSRFLNWPSSESGSARKRRTATSKASRTLDGMASEAS